MKNLSMKHQRGFTLVELLVVIAIIGLLSTIGVVSLNSARAKARDAKRLSDVRQMASIMELYYNGAQQYSHAATAGQKMDGGCIDESTTGVKASACSGVILLATIPSAPTPPTGQEYRYFAYRSAAPATGAGTDCDVVAEVCASYGIEFTLETTVSGVAAGKNCLNQGGISGGACPVPAA